MGNDLPKRKKTRLTNFDYSSHAAYFITICTKDRKNILSSIVGEGSPLPQLSAFGKTVDRHIQGISKKYCEISVDQYVIMPNHIHLLLTLSPNDGRGDPSPTITSVVGWQKYQCTKDINTLCETVGQQFFQRSFYDHIVRNRDDYEAIRRYIYENPKIWQTDKFYSK